MTVYLAGKIYGDSNYKAKFDAAQKKLEDMGYVVLSPAILPSQGFEYDAYLRISDAMRRECEAICLLPDWIDSNGAIGEYQKALDQGQKIIFYSEVLLDATA